MAGAPITPGQPLPMQPGEFAGAAQPNLVSFIAKGVPPPSELYIQRDDVLVFAGICSNSGATATVTVRLWLAAEGRITTIQQQVQVPTALTVATAIITLAEGYLLSATVSNFAGNPAFSQYAMLAIHRGNVSFPLPNPAYMLFAGYVYADVPMGWPGGGVNPPGSGLGYTRILAVNNPGAGNDWALTVPTNTMWEFVCFNAVLTTSGTVANRQPQVFLDDGTNVHFVGNPSGSIPATTTANITGSQQPSTSVVVATDISVPIAQRNLMTANFRLRTSTVNIQAGDAYTTIRVQVREWLVP